VQKCALKTHPMTVPFARRYSLKKKMTGLGFSNEYKLREERLITIDILSS
jgi:hypothetical protein